MQSKVYSPDNLAAALVLVAIPGGRAYCVLSRKINAKLVTRMASTILRYTPLRESDASALFIVIELWESLR